MRSFVLVKAHAKLNLGLSVLGLRPDGFHEVHTHLQTISLADELRFERTGGGLSLDSSPDLGIPEEKNLAYQAMALFQAQTGSSAVHCTLIKRIPAGAGLGGGSSDAAATLVALNALFETGLSAQELAQWGAQLGSDVPFFLHGGFACAKGRGERLQPLLPIFEDYHFVVIVPPFECATGQVYRAWDELADAGAATPDESDCWKLGLHNDLEKAACQQYPELRTYARFIQKAPTALKGMSGSGSAWYAGFAQPAQALAYQRQLEGQGLAMKVFSVTSIPAGVKVPNA